MIILYIIGGILLLIILAFIGLFIWLLTYDCPNDGLHYWGGRSRRDDLTDEQREECEGWIAYYRDKLEED